MLNCGVEVCWDEMGSVGGVKLDLGFVGIGQVLLDRLWFLLRLGVWALVGDLLFLTVCFILVRV